LRNTDNNHPDFAGLKEAVDKIHKLTTFVNQKKKESEDAATVVSILQKITRKRPSDLLVHSRKFVKEGPLNFSEHGQVKYKEGHVFLFSDLLVLASKIVNKNEFTYRGQLSLRNASVENLKDDSKHKNAIMVKGTRNILLIASKAEDKDLWMRTLLNTIFAHNSS